MVERFGVPYLICKILSVVFDLYECPLNAANLFKAYVVLFSNDLSEIPIFSVKCKSMFIPITNNDDISDSDEWPPYDSLIFAVFQLLM